MKILKGNIITPFFHFYGEILIKDGMITEIKKGTLGINKELVEDYSNCFICPGFINIHLHGAVGYDFMDHNAKAFLEISRYLASSGVTGFLGTTMTMSEENIRQTLSLARNILQNDKLLTAILYGIHLEGPCISKKFRRAQNLRYIKEDVNFLRNLVRDYPSVIKTVTIAPELNECEKLVKELISQKIYVSAGHTDADFSMALKAFNWGINRVTHLFNAMPPIHHRSPGIVTAALLDKRVFVEIIPDGVHLHPAMLDLIVRFKGEDRVCLITDSIRATGLKDGKYSLGGQEVIVQGKEARLLDGTLAGSVVSMDQAVRNIISFTGVSVQKAIEMASYTPACAIGLDKITGSLEKGKQADIIILDNQLEVLMTMVKGMVVYRKSKG